MSTVILRRWGFQLLLVAVLLMVGHLAWSNLNANLQQRGLSLGFGFLQQESGFEIAFSVIPYRASDSYMRVFFVGLTNTILITVLTIVLSTILGFIIGIARLSPSWALSKAALVYVEIVRNLPQLLHILLWYNVALRNLPAPRRAIELFDTVFLTNRGIYVPAVRTDRPLLWAATVILGIVCAVGCHMLVSRLSARRESSPRLRLLPVAIFLLIPALVWLGSGSSLSIDRPERSGFNFTGGWVLVPELSALVFAMSIYNAAFIAELVRASIESVNRGQKEASAAIGFNWPQTLRYVVIPQAFRVLLPPLGNQYLNILKASSLAVTIGFPDLVSVFTGVTMNQTGRAVEIVAMTMVTYLLLGLVLTLIISVLNHLTRIVER